LSCFFFQAEDGIRGLIVTGVQTCALPISKKATSATPPTLCSVAVARMVASASSAILPKLGFGACPLAEDRLRRQANDKTAVRMRSEERRVGKEGSRRWAPGQ